MNGLLTGLLGGLSGVGQGIHDQNADADKRQDIALRTEEMAMRRAEHAAALQRQSEEDAARDAARGIFAGQAPNPNITVRLPDPASIEIPTGGQFTSALVSGFRGGSSVSNAATGNAPANPFSAEAVRAQGNRGLLTSLMGARTAAPSLVTDDPNAAVNIMRNTPRAPLTRTIPNSNQRQLTPDKYIDYAQTPEAIKEREQLTKDDRLRAAYRTAGMPEDKIEAALANPALATDLMKPAPDRNIDPYSDEGIAAAIKRAAGIAKATAEYRAKSGADPALHAIQILHSKNLQDLTLAQQYLKTLTAEGDKAGYDSKEPGSPLYMRAVHHQTLLGIAQKRLSDAQQRVEASGNRLQDRIGTVLGDVQANQNSAGAPPGVDPGEWAAFMSDRGNKRPD